MFCSCMLYIFNSWQLSGKELANFHCVYTPSKTEFKLPMIYHWIQSCEDMSWLPWAGMNRFWHPSDTDHALGLCDWMSQVLSLYHPFPTTFLQSQISNYRLCLKWASSLVPSYISVTFSQAAWYFPLASHSLCCLMSVFPVCLWGLGPCLSCSPLSQQPSSVWYTVDTQYILCPLSFETSTLQR